MCAIAGWDVKMIRYCSMHCSNIGILIALNGSLVDLLCERSLFRREKGRAATGANNSVAPLGQCQPDRTQSKVYITKGMHRRDARGLSRIAGESVQQPSHAGFPGSLHGNPWPGTCDDLEVQLASSVAQLMRCLA